jgi:hypothetical protein
VLETLGEQIHDRASELASLLEPNGAGLSVLETLGERVHSCCASDAAPASTSSPGLEISGSSDQERSLSPPGLEILGSSDQERSPHRADALVNTLAPAEHLGESSGESFDELSDLTMV